MAKPMVNIQEKIDLYEKKYRDYLDFYESKSVLAQTKGVSAEDLFALGSQLEQFEAYKTYFTEADGSKGDLGVLPNIALDVITASASQSAVPLLASIQPLEEEQGTIYFKNVVSSTSRGNVNKGDTLLSGATGRSKIGRAFAGELVSNEVDAKGDGSTTDFAWTVKYAPARVRTVEITVQGQDNTKLLDDGKGNLIGIGGKGSIDYDNGNVKVSFDTAPDDGAEIYTTYETNFEDIEEIPTIKSEYDSVGIRARVFALRTDISALKSFSMSKRFGTNVEESIAKDLTEELTAEISAEVVAEAYVKAVGNTEWNKTAPSGVSFTEHKLTLFDKIAEAESTILNNAGRIGGNVVLVAGTKASATLRTMPGFRLADNIITSLGTTYYGSLDGRVVIRSTVIPENEILMITKGSGMFDTSLVYAPYMPLMMTSTQQGFDHNPLKSQKAVAVQSGIKTVVPQLITKLTIVED